MLFPINPIENKDGTRHQKGQHLTDHGVEVAAVDPVESMKGVDAEGLDIMADDVRTRLVSVVEAV